MLCCASACCAGVLCTVLWERFARVPAVLTLHSPHSEAGRHKYQAMPLVAICPTPEAVAKLFTQRLNPAANQTQWLPGVLSRILHRKRNTRAHLQQVESLLAAKNVSLREAVFDMAPSCQNTLKKCRWQNVMIDCDNLFQKEYTAVGVCCTMRGDGQTIQNAINGDLEYNLKLDLLLECANESTSDGCEFLTKYHGEEWPDPTYLTLGHHYFVQMSFTSVQDSETEKLVDAMCAPDSAHSQRTCVAKCRERQCGCSDPLRYVYADEIDVPPPCTITRFSCITDSEGDYRRQCKCLPLCKRVLSDISVESYLMDTIESAFDPIFENVKVSSSISINLRVNLRSSRIFDSIATETWLTLMSSLGGVFSMFLGVGLFSALELLFLVLIKLPSTIYGNPLK